MANPTFHTYWTKQRVDDGLRKYYADHGAAPGARRYDQVVAPLNAGKRLAERPYPDSPTVRKYYPTMHAAWTALGIEPGPDCQARGPRRGNGAASAETEKRRPGRPKGSGTKPSEPVALEPRYAELEHRLSALEADRRGLMDVVRLLVDGDGPELDERRGLVRAGIAIGAAAARGARR